MAYTYEDACEFFKLRGLYLISHPVVIHHLRKDFVDYDVTRYRFMLAPVGKDFMHVAVVEHEHGINDVAVQIRYTCAGDDLLYGLRTKFTSGGSIDNNKDVLDIITLLGSKNLRTHERYVRKRFRHGRTKAKVRALVVMMREVWSSLFSFK